MGLIAFSRIFLGVHTPQDILVGAGAGVLVMFLTGKLLLWLEAHQNKDIIIALVGILIAVAAAVFSALKPYPEDYDAFGNLLVDGHKMANDTFKAVGWLSAFFAGWILERRFVGFTLFFASIGQDVTQRTGDILPDYFDPFQTDPLSSQSREKRRDILEPLIEDNR